MGGDRLGGRPWEDPGVFGINKRRPHVKTRSYSFPEDVLATYTLLSDRERSSRHHSLNGQDWDFALYPSPDSVPPAAELGTQNPSHSWHKVRSPLHALHGSARTHSLSIGEGDPGSHGGERGRLEAVHVRVPARLPARLPALTADAPPCADG